jgi:hypothetical protein
MAIILNVGQPETLTIAYLDQNGQPMATTPTPDAPPTWSNANPAVDALTVAADGNSATDTGLSGGTDTINLNLSVGGVAFSASAAVTVTPPAQVLSSIEIVAGTPADAAPPAA